MADKAKGRSQRSTEGWHKITQLVVVITELQGAELQISVVRMARDLLKGSAPRGNTGSMKSDTCGPYNWRWNSPSAVGTNGMLTANGGMPSTRKLTQ